MCSALGALPAAALPPEQQLVVPLGTRWPGLSLHQGAAGLPAVLLLLGLGSTHTSCYPGSLCQAGTAPTATCHPRATRRGSVIRGVTVQHISACPHVRNCVVVEGPGTLQASVAAVVGGCAGLVVQGLANTAPRAVCGGPGCLMGGCDREVLGIITLPQCVAEVLSTSSRGWLQDVSIDLNFALMSSGLLFTKGTPALINTRMRIQVGA